MSSCASAGSLRGFNQAPGAGVDPRSCEGSKLRLGVHAALDDAEQVKGAAREAVNPRHRHRVAGANFPSIRLNSRRSSPLARHLLAIDILKSQSSDARRLN
jgi:hypothetical protein